MPIQRRTATLLPRLDLKTLVAVCTLAVSSLTGAAPGLSQEVSKPQLITVFGKATLEVPGDFERTQPASRIVEDEFVAKSGEGAEAATARVYMMASGGSLDANLDRWKGQFSAADAERFKTEKLKLENWDIVVAEQTGTYSDQMGGGPFAPGRTVQRPDYGMMGAIIVAPDPDSPDTDLDRRPKYFVKMIGPKGVIEANREAFLGMVKSLRPR